MPARTQSDVRSSQLVTIATAGLAVAFLLWRGWERRWMSDDGFINLRVVKQITAGNGPVFNAGERVEAGTSPLWIACLTVADVLLPLRLEWIAVLLGIALTGLGAAALLHGSATLWRHAGHTGPMLPVGVVCLVALSPVWDFSSSGLEGGLGWTWLGACFLLLARWAVAPSRRVSVPTAVVVGLGPLIRPDFLVFSAASLAILLVACRGAGPRSMVRVVLAAGVVPAGFQLFRMAYYGALVPNTYFAKEGGTSWWDQGWYYVVDLFGTYWLWVPLVLLGLGGTVPLVRDLSRRDDERPVLVVAVFPLAAVLSALSIVRLGGDFMHARLLLPAVFAMLAPVAYLPVRRELWVGLAAVGWALVGLVGLDPPPPDTEVASRYVLDHRRSLVALLGNEHPVTVANFRPTSEILDTHELYSNGPLEINGDATPLAPGAPRVVYVAYGVGAVGYGLGEEVHVVDGLGLGDTIAARLEMDGRGRRPGHEKVLPEPWIWARYIDADLEPVPGQVDAPELLTSAAATTLDPVDRSRFEVQVGAARDALGCGELDRLRDATTSPLTASRALGNVRDSFRLFSFRVSPDPVVAREALC